MEILIFTFFIVFLFLAIKRQDLATSFIIVFLPSYLIRFTILTIPFTLLESMILTTFVVWFFKKGPNIKELIKKRKNKIKYPFYIEIILILIIASISVIVANFSIASLGILKAYFIEPVLFFVLVINLLNRDKGRSKIFISLTFLALLVSIFAIYQKITGQFIPNEFWSNIETRRVVSWFTYPNAVGLLLAPISILLLGYFHYLPKRTDLKNSLKKIIIIITILLSFLSIYFAKSEGAMIALMLSLTIFYFFYNKKCRKIISGILLILILSLFFYKPLGNYVFDKLSFKDLSGQIRLQQWSETMQTLKGDSFYLGNGLSSYQEAVKPYHQEGIFYNFDNIENFDAVVWANKDLHQKYWQPVEIYLYPHNIFLNFWTELGLFGMIIFVLLICRFLFISLKIYFKQKKENKKNQYILLSLFSAMLVVVIHGLVDVPYFKNDLSVLFFLILAVLATFIIEQNNNI